jgi:protein-tyrosine-phosphatase
MHILFVCTANQNRSPMAEVLLRARVPDAEVRSAGRLDGGVAASDGAMRAVAARGLDLGGHRSSVVTPEAVADADLIVCMAREHLREVVLAHPDAFGKTFTLKELVRRGSATGPREPDQPLSSWLALVHTGRRTSDLLGDSPDDDVDDPIGRPDAVFAATAAEIDALLEQLVRLVAA